MVVWHVWIPGSHGHAVHVVSDSLVKFQLSMKCDMKAASVCVCVCASDVGTN